MFVTYESLAEDSKVWIYPSNRKFYKDEITTIEEKLKTFAEQWKSDTENFQVSYRFLYNRFIILVADVHDIPLKNSDIDEMVAFIFKLQSEYDVELLDKMNVCFKQGEYTQYKDLKEFKKLIKNKSVSEKTIVFDNLIETKDELENFWEVPITESWYNRFL